MRHLRRTALAVVAATAVALLPAAAEATGTDVVEYAALGDSYSSGSGAGPYTDFLCQRSDHAHPVLLAAELDAHLTFVACGGATTEDVLEEQIDALDEDTDLVTIGVGGNDIGWTDAILACIVPLYDCTWEIAEAERKVIEELPAKLDAVYAAITAAAPSAEVYVTGYPRLFAAENTCDALGLISIAEQERMNDGADLLSETIAGVAHDHGFTFVDMRDAFDDHAICADEPWIHGLTIFEVPYHPNVDGHLLGYHPTLSAAL
ncbi:SGNH family lipase [Glycomyces albus]